MIELQQTSIIEGAHVLITGGTSGIGEASVRAFCDAGARVSFCGRRTVLGRAIADELIELGRSIRFFECDIREQNAVERFHQSAFEEFGTPRLVFNNAGISHSTAQLQELDAAEVSDVLQTNIYGLWFCLQVQIPPMTRSGGVIINMASALAHSGAGWLSIYGASKHAVVGLTRSAAQELRGDKLKIVSLSPGPVRTPMFARALESVKGHPERFAGGLPDDGILEPEEIATYLIEIAKGRINLANGVDLSIDSLDDELESSRI